MKYVSTRGSAPVTGFEGALVAGLADDGGLYIPQSWQQLSADELRALRGRPYGDVAHAVIAPFVGGEIPDDTLRGMIDEAYAAFAHRAVTPLKQLDANQWLLELFHGPTLAFKDVAMQLLSRMMDWALEKRGERATIIGATSGDTGSAAIEAFRSSSRCEIFILHPHGRVSDVQRRQMTTVDSPNVHNIALEGTFDDCQALLKDLFGDKTFRDTHNMAGVNSINWARIMPQIVYYVSAALALGSPDIPVNFTVPTGNFGDIFAGYVAKRMGLPVGELVVATNINDILHRAISTGRYEVQGVTPTTSPSMDIQVSSNFERLLFDASGRDADAVTAMMQGLRQSGAFTIPPAALESIQSEFVSHRCDEQGMAQTLKQVLAETGELVDPHTAVGLNAARNLATGSGPMVTLATAHPAKFPDAVREASGREPELPAHLADLFDKPERFEVIANDFEAVKGHIETCLTS
jgi:threonine synthase